MLCTSLLLVLYAEPKGKLHGNPEESWMIHCSPMGIVELAMEVCGVDPAVQSPCDDCWSFKHIICVECFEQAHLTMTHHELSSMDMRAKKSA